MMENHQRMNIAENVRLDQYTTLHVGGVADYFIDVTTMEELREACLFAKQTGRPPLILGGGSNLLVSDDGYRGAVLHIRISGRDYASDARDYVSPEETVYLTVGAGETFDDVVAETVSKGLWGLENLSSIPGTAGATPVQNVGAYGIEISELIVQVEAVHTTTGEQKIFLNEECGFSYRDSFFKTEVGRLWVITAVTFRLSKTPRPKLSYNDLSPLRKNEDVSIDAVRAHVQAVRATKFPDWTKVGTAGSFFKNPIITATHFKQLQTLYPNLPGYEQADGGIKVSLGWILDKVCELKGYRIDNVGLYDKQALVLVAYEGATATGVKKFTEEIKEKVRAATEIFIECEVQFV